MKTMVFNVHGSSINKGGESVALRVGYLLSDYVVAAGTTGYDICFETWFNPPKLEQKVQWIENFYKNRGEDDGLRAAEVRESMKAMRKIKHLDKKGIVTLKKLEKAVEVLFKIAKGEALEEQMKSGLPQLDSLFDGKVLGGYYINSDKPEEKQGDEQHAISTLLSLDLPDPEEGLSLFLLPYEFLVFLQNRNLKWFSARDSGAGKVDNIYLEKCISFAQVNILNAVELKTLRQQFEPLAIPFRKAVDRWMELCYGTSSPQEKLTHFRQQVQITAAPINSIIKQNEVLNHYDRLFNQTALTNVLMGEVPVKLIWEFFYEQKAIKDESREKLMQIYETRNLKDKRWPVLALEFPQPKESSPPVTIKEGEIKAVKKSISVD